jgi:hypothetical protein
MESRTSESEPAVFEAAIPDLLLLMQMGYGDRA